jgi:hypothetical protein
LPIELWENIAEEFNQYRQQQKERRLDEMVQRQQQRVQRNPDYTPKTRAQLSDRYDLSKDVSPSDLLVLIGLLIAHAIAPNKEKFAHHWKTVDEEAISRGSFGKFMARDRFTAVGSDLHLSSNTDPRASRDRAWKIGPVVDMLQMTFQKGYGLPPAISFDEVMLPNRSTFNKTRCI